MVKDCNILNLNHYSYIVYIIFIITSKTNLFPYLDPIELFTLNIINYFKYNY